MELNYKKLGSGKPLIILHGLFGSLDNWMTLGKRWSEDYEVWLVDQRNHGHSPHDDAFDYPIMAEDLESFIAMHSIKKPIILGHSMGGKTAMEFAVNFPEMVSKLIVADIAPVEYEVHHYGIVAALKSVDLNSIRSRKEADEMLSNRIKTLGIRQFLLKNLYLKEKNRYAWRFNLPVLERQLEPISHWPVSEGLYEGKSLFIKGANSDYILPQHGAEIVRKFPNYELEEIENAGHWLHAEAPDEFFQKVNNFIKQ